MSNIPTERRLALMFKENPNFTLDDLKKVYGIFEHLRILQNIRVYWIL